MIFSLFRRRKPEDVYRSVAADIVWTSLGYRIGEGSAEAGAEMAYLLLHIVDKTAFDLLGASRRDTVFDEIATRVIAEYAREFLKPDMPEDASSHIAKQMLNTLNARQLIYAQCDSFMGETGEHLFPSRGTVVFAYCYFVHVALGHTARTDVDDILTGKRDVSKLEMDDFPDPPVLMQAAADVTSTLARLRIPDELKRLK